MSKIFDWGKVFDWLFYPALVVWAIWFAVEHWGRPYLTMKHPYLMAVAEMACFWIILPAVVLPLWYCFGDRKEFRRRFGRRK